MSRIKLKCFDKLVIIYMLITAIYMMIGINYLENSLTHFVVRLLVFCIILFISMVRSETRVWLFFRNFYPLLLISYFYNETAFLNNILFENIDPFLYKSEELLLGFHPSISFAYAFPSKWYSELMHFGYFSYYLMAFGTLLLFYFNRNQEFGKVMFIILASFFIYYLIFSIIPSIGPQFYLPAEDQKVPEGFIFQKIMRFILTHAESETAAFPSSHVGMAIIYLIILFKDFKRYFYILIPFTLILIFSTVYIKAHYAIDVIAGLISAPIVFKLAKTTRLKVMFCK